MDFELDAREHNDWLVITITGDVDVYTVSRLSGFFTDHLPAHPPADARNGVREGVVVDVSAVTFIDSAGLGALVKGYRRARDASQVFRLAGPSDQLRMMLAVTGLTAVMQTYDDVDSATH